MKTAQTLCFMIALATFASCKKENANNEATTSTSSSTSSTSTTSANTDHYVSIADFFSQNGAQMQTYTINGTNGGSFTSPQGTIVTVPANAFQTQAGAAVAGTVTVEFKDLFKKSDMLLSDKSTNTLSGAPLKSGGEFFIRAMAGGEALVLAPNKKIEVTLQASLTGSIDNVNAQSPWVLEEAVDSVPDSNFVMGAGWVETTENKVITQGLSYIYDIYRFSTPAESGSWCNSDNSTFFAGYPLTRLTLIPTDNISAYQTQVFLAFKTVNSMVHVYNNGVSFSYDYAPLGLECTAVALGVKDGKAYSAFVPITISANQIVNFTLSETTTDAFINKLKTLN